MVQQDNVDAKGVALFACGLVAVGVGVYVAVWLLFGYFNRVDTAAGASEYPLAASQEQRLPPEPRLQTNPRGDLRALRDEENQILNSYKWVDKGAGIVRIPIERAMKLTLERGLPARAAQKEGR
jgi:hypothetical protein